MKIPSINISFGRRDASDSARQAKANRIRRRYQVSGGSSQDNAAHAGQRSKLPSSKATPPVNVPSIGNRAVSGSADSRQTRDEIRVKYNLKSRAASSRPTEAEIRRKYQIKGQNPAEASSHSDSTGLMGKLRSLAGAIKNLFAFIFPSR